MHRKLPLLFSFVLIALACGLYDLGSAEETDVLSRIVTTGMSANGAFRMLTELTDIGGRPAGSAQDRAAAEWAQKTMRSLSLDNVRLQPVTVFRWTRGNTEEAVVRSGGKSTPLTVVALGGSSASPEEGVTAGIIEVHSVPELQALGEKVKGKIVFYNGPMDSAHFNTFNAYSLAADQRYRGPREASRLGAAGALVRSMTLAQDDIPHTGGTRFDEGIPPIPSAAVSTKGADLLSGILKQYPDATLTLKLSATLNGEAPSANVIGEITGAEKPQEIVVISAHLDSWDLGTGAHDDGAGCAHVLEAMSLLRSLGIRPKRTIRAVLFANEEFGLDGAEAYAEALNPQEIHVAAIESDAGGFTPRGFAVEATGEPLRRILAFSERFKKLGADEFIQTHSGADISVLVKKGVPGIGFMPDSQRYFDYHHSAKDTLDKVHPREVELGAISIAYMAYLLSEEL